MPRLRLESATDAFDLDEVSETGYGAEALSGVTGLGLPAVTLQFLEGAGDGAVYRGRRVLLRDIDTPLYLLAPDRESLKALHTRVSRMLSGKMTFRFVEDDGSDWRLDVYRVGGGSYTYGVDTVGERELRMVVTLRAPDPFWTYSIPSVRTFGTENPGRGLIKSTSLIKLRISGVQPQGPVTLENEGDADAYPVWELNGPMTSFSATSPDGRSFAWSGTLNAGESITIDSKTASVKDNTGANRYGELAPAPKFWLIPPGISVANLTLATTGAPTVRISWEARKWAIL